MLKRILVASCFLTSASLMAGSDMSPDKSSGCGYGWEVTKQKTLIGSLTRNTINATASNSIAMTMGTSGCEKHDIVLKEKAQEVFVEANYENILSDMAEGRGEYLSSIANMMGCDNANFGANAQKGLEKLQDESSTALLSNLKTACI
jgi:hypothetical protein